MLKTVFAKIGIELNDLQVKQFETYYNLLCEWNEKINLTAITEKEDVYLKHFIDSAVCLCHENISGKVIDVGTGAGFPGFVLKILKPEIKLTLLDSLNKRIEFLKCVGESLELNDVEYIHSRAEDAGKDKKYREQFDYVVARAVANLSTLSEYCIPFAKVGGSFLSMKGPDASEEIESAKSAIYKLGGEVLEYRIYNLPDSDINHSVISVKKLRQTPAGYPRKAGKPSKEPLK